MGDFSHRAADVAGRIAVVVINVRSFVLLCVTYSTFVPVLFAVFIPFGAVIVRRGVVFPDSIERYVACYVVGCPCDHFAVFARCPALELLARRSGEAVCGKCL